MFRSFLSVMIVAWLVVGCTAQRKNAANANLDGTWVLAVFPHQQKTLAEVFGTRVIELQFDASKQTVAGTTGCNRFTGTYTADTTLMRFSPNLALTKMACGNYDESLFLNALRRVNRYRLVEGQLELLQDNEIAMILARKL